MKMKNLASIAANPGLLALAVAKALSIHAEVNFQPFRTVPIE
jgi:hypothetical protein